MQTEFYRRTPEYLPLLMQGVWLTIVVTFFSCS